MDATTLSPNLRPARNGAASSWPRPTGTTAGSETGSSRPPDVRSSSAAAGLARRLQKQVNEALGAALDPQMRALNDALDDAIHKLAI